jgi:hypothetical protein
VDAADAASTTDPNSGASDAATRNALLAVTAELEATHAAYLDGHAALLDRYGELTELLRSVRLGLTSGPYDDLLDDIDRQLIALLNQGVRRPVVAAKAGITTYDMDRRLRRMYVLTGSKTQFQFGRACVSRLWLPPDVGVRRLGG